MNRHVAIALALTLITACQSGEYSGPRTTSAEDGVSFAELKSYTARREQGALLLTGTSKQTIAVRAVPADAWSEPRTPDNVLPSVARVLAAMPSAVVTGPFEVEHPSYRAVAFDVVFAPPGLAGRRYERRHVVLFGDRKVIHVLATAPAGQLQRSHKDLDKVVASMREEG